MVVITIMLVIILIVILIVIDSYIIIKGITIYLYYNDNNDENNAQNKDNKIYIHIYKKIESMWMIILNNNNYINNK